MPPDWPIEEYKDVASQNYYKEYVLAVSVRTCAQDRYYRVQEERRQKTGQKDPDMSDVHAGLRVRARDHARTPMQWSAAPNAGFSPEGVETWMRVHDDYKEWNAAKQKDEPDSALAFYKQMLSIKKQHDIFVRPAFLIVLHSLTRSNRHMANSPCWTRKTSRYLPTQDSWKGRSC